jgi:acyl-CoA-binding protein
MQATRGENGGERPMWAEKGNIDFEGRARWDAWSALRGLDPERARLRFVKLYHEFSGDQLYKDGRGVAS